VNEVNDANESADPLGTTFRSASEARGPGVKPRRVGEVSEGIFRGEYSL